ncbi:hypothetical protein B0H13DRAFT_2318977 [Mycena leptocephala]|nr:hypothetical protein B0H13DRAFT_2318977 [Mycena leptocephala]
MQWLDRLSAYGEPGAAESTDFDVFSEPPSPASTRSTTVPVHCILSPSPPPSVLIPYPMLMLSS